MYSTLLYGVVKLVDNVGQCFYILTDLLSICSINYCKRVIGVSIYSYEFFICPLRNISFCFMNLKLIIIRYENILLGMKT